MNKGLPYLTTHTHTHTQNQQLISCLRKKSKKQNKMFPSHIERIDDIS